MKENFTSGSVGGSWNRNAHGHRETGSGPVRHRASSLPDHAPKVSPRNRNHTVHHEAEKYQLTSSHSRGFRGNPL